MSLLFAKLMGSVLALGGLGALQARESAFSWIWGLQGEPAVTLSPLHPQQKAELEPGGQKELHCPVGPASYSAVASRGVPVAPFGGFLAVKVAPPYPPRVWCVPDTGPALLCVRSPHPAPGSSERGGPVT